MADIWQTIVTDYWIADAMLRAAGDWLTDWVDAGITLWVVGGLFFLLARGLYQRVCK